MQIKSGVKIPSDNAILGTSAATIYTVPATLNRIKVDEALLVNYGANPIVVDLWVIQSGQSLADKYKIIDTKALGSNESYPITEILGMALNAGGTIDAQSDTATSASFTATVTEYAT